MATWGSITRCQAMCSRFRPSFSGLLVQLPLRRHHIQMGSGISFTLPGSSSIPATAQKKLSSL